MIQAILDDHLDLLTSLRVQIRITEDYLIRDESYFKDHITFFTRSFIVNLCSYIESYIKHLFRTVISGFETELQKLHIPQELILWAIKKDAPKEPTTRLSGFVPDFQIFSNQKALNEFIESYASPNPDKIIKGFRLIGIYLDYFDDFHTGDELRERITTLVSKRNQIIHHNDAAGDLTFADVSEYINVVERFFRRIHQIIQARYLQK